MTSALETILEAEGLSALLSKFTEQGVTDSILADLTDGDLKDLGIEKLGERKRLLAVFGKSGGAAVALSVVEESLSPSSSTGVSSNTAATPVAATKEQPFVNSLGIPFVPIPRFETRFAIWPIRVQDYEAYCMASGAKFPEVPFSQESDHPIVGVTWNDAIEFCVWLTGKERSEGKIDEKTVYRLPTDLEWSAAVGLPHEPEPTPEKRHLKAPGYPWGLRWPPPRNAGNYEHARRDQLEISASADSAEDGVNSDISSMNQRGIDGAHDKYIMSWQWVIKEMRIVAARWVSEWAPIDEHEFTSPVSAFKPNDLGIHDLGGNVWEWCMDMVLHENENQPVARGGSFALSPSFGFSEREVNYGSIDFSSIGRQPEMKKVYLTVENQRVYRSSYRHVGVSSYSPFKGAIVSTEYDRLMPREWSRIPCGGFRIVVTNS